MTPQRMAFSAVTAADFDELVALRWSAASPPIVQPARMKRSIA
jgi:hypothetical protein